jgi:hypothetical protein
MIRGFLFVMHGTNGSVVKCWPKNPLDSIRSDCYKVSSVSVILPVDHRLTARHGAVLKGKLPEALAPSMSLDTVCRALYSARLA